MKNRKSKGFQKLYQKKKKKRKKLKEKTIFAYNNLRRKLIISTHNSVYKVRKLD